MKNLIFAAPALIVTLALSASGQVKSVAAANNQNDAKPSADKPLAANASRARVMKPETPSASQFSSLGNAPILKTPVKTDFNGATEGSRTRRTVTGEKSDSLAGGATSSENRSPIVTGPGSVQAGIANHSNALMASTQLYRVGPKDVLDINLAGSQSRKVHPVYSS